jgi:hypothetical protein
MSYINFENLKITFNAQLFHTKLIWGVNDTIIDGDILTRLDDLDCVAYSRIVFQLT